VSAARILPLAVVIGLVPPGLRAMAAERTAVLISAVAPADGTLAANLTDVVVARVAQRGHETVASEELRARLRLASDQEARRCAEVAACLGRAVLALAVARVLVGDVHAQGARYRFHLALHDLATGTVSQRVVRTIDGGLEQLIAAVQDATDAMFRPQLRPGRLLIDSTPGRARVLLDNVFVGVTPMQVDGVSPGWHQLSVEPEGRFPWSSSVQVLEHADLQVRLTPDQLPRRGRWPSYLALGSAAGAALCLVGGGLLGVASEVDSHPPSRLEAMRDFERRRRMGHVATGMLVCGGALAALSAYTLVRYREHVFGRTRAD
jgi:hypothetical protein